MKKICLVTLIVLSFLLMGQSYAFANINFKGSELEADFVQTSNLQINATIQGDSTLLSVGKVIAGVVAYICYAAAVIVVLVKGVQFMSAAPEAKAELKKQLVAIAIGAFILFGIGGILQIIANTTANLI